MDLSQQLPQGFSNALKQNHEAARFFSGCTDAQKQAIIAQAHLLSSPQDMQALAANLPSAAL